MKKLNINFSLKLFLLLMIFGCQPNQKKETSNNEVKLPVIKKNAKSTEIYNQQKEENAKKFFSLSQDEQIKYQSSFLNEIYSCFFNSAPTEKDQQKWLNTLLQGGTREGIIRNLFSSSQFLKQSNDQPSNYKFSKKDEELYLKYVGIQNLEEVATSQTKEMFKKLLFNQVLDLIDAFESQDKLSSWYANFSVDIAKRLNSEKIKVSTLRLKNNLDYHQQWSKSVHRDFVKAETILKFCLILK